MILITVMLSLADKHIADQKMIDSINAFPNQSLTERAIKNTIQVKKKLGLGLDSKVPKNVKSRPVKN